jgi:hypothetical protein
VHYYKFMSLDDIYYAVVPYRKSSSNSSVIGYTMNGNGSGMSLGMAGSQPSAPSAGRPQQVAGQQQRQHHDPRGQQGQPGQQQQVNHKSNYFLKSN